jgi:uncharacterized membrane protein YphA (DoxX/SURF4 family)
MRNSILKNITGWAIIILAILSAWLIYYFEKFNLPFLLLLFLELAIIIRYNKIFTPAMVTASRIMLGLLFIFSGFVKGVDPMGTAYRLEDYFTAFKISWLSPYSIVFSFLLNAVELMLGGLLILNIKPRLTAALTLTIMGFFTLTTLNDALFSPVPDCGCFGDAILLTNWQTFYKNLVINVLVLILFFNRNHIRSLYSISAVRTLTVALFALFIGFQMLNYINLPMVDFRAWKVGNRLFPENPEPIRYYLTFKNIATGETKEYLSPDYPYNDPAWVENWEFVSQRIEDPNIMPGIDLAIIDFEGNDVTGNYFKIPDYHFIVIAWDLKKANEKAMQQINHLYHEAEAEGKSFIIVTSTLDKGIQEYTERTNLLKDAPFYNSDDIALKTVVRANPGLVLVNNGQIVAKWHHNFLPEWENIEEKYLN